MIKSLKIIKTKKAYLGLFINFLRQNVREVDKIHNEFLADAVKIIINKKHFSYKDKYNIASYFKKSGDYKTSRKLFFDLIYEINNLEKYFHLGEICLNHNKRNSAIEHFLKSLEYFPFHQKNKDYLWSFT